MVDGRPSLSLVLSEGGEGHLIVTIFSVFAVLLFDLYITM